MVFPCLMQKWHVLMTGKVLDFIFWLGFDPGHCLDIQRKYVLDFDVEQCPGF